MYMAGVSLNIMSLGGLALGIGMLVDNAIVVLESITRCREEGDDVGAAAVRGVSEVAGAVTASTLTTDRRVRADRVRHGGRGPDLRRPGADRRHLALVSSPGGRRALHPDARVPPAALARPGRRAADRSCPAAAAPPRSDRRWTLVQPRRIRQRARRHGALVHGPGRSRDCDSRSRRPRCSCSGRSPSPCGRSDGSSTKAWKRARARLRPGALRLAARADPRCSASRARCSPSPGCAMPDLGVELLPEIHQGEFTALREAGRGAARSRTPTRCCARLDAADPPARGRRDDGADGGHREGHAHARDRGAVHRRA